MTDFTIDPLLQNISPIPLMARRDNIIRLLTDRKDTKAQTIIEQLLTCKYYSRCGNSICPFCLLDEIDHDIKAQRYCCERLKPSRIYAVQMGFDIKAKVGDLSWIKEVQNTISDVLCGQRLVGHETVISGSIQLSRTGTPLANLLIVNAIRPKGSADHSKLINYSTKRIPHDRHWYMTKHLAPVLRPYLAGEGVTNSLHPLLVDTDFLMHVNETRSMYIPYIAFPRFLLEEIYGEDNLEFLSAKTF